MFFGWNVVSSILNAAMNNLPVISIKKININKNYADDKPIVEKKKK